MWALALLGLATVPWFDHLTRQAGRPELTQLNASTIPYLAAIVVAATVGVVLAGRRPRHPVGWLLLTLGLCLSTSGAAAGYVPYGLVRPGVLPAAVSKPWWTGASTGAAITPPARSRRSVRGCASRSTWTR